MDRQLWARATEVFERASPLEGEERKAYLEDACGDDESLRDVVERMLSADTGTQELLQRGVQGWAAFLDAHEDEPPEVLGPYRVLREIGRGGMATVYLGERADGRFERTVALKVIQDGLVSRRLADRFESEARILAGLEHPHIARLYDVGAHEGRPYLVMEHVEGERIDRFCDGRRLGLRPRLELFRQVCGAVQFAHRNLVIHRDLKPSNILVTPGGSVRLLDFGIAKLLQTGDEAGETLTRFPVLTPEYASPEQIQGTELTTASDVYSLGVLLYELLTGRRPFEAAPGDLASLGKRIATEPTSPSAVVKRPHEKKVDRHGTTETVEPATVGDARGTTPERLRRALKGDLDRIALEALRPDPADRYASAEALSEDVRRYLGGLPVSARRDSVPYRARMFVRRHRVGVAVATLLVASLATTAAVAVRQARIAGQERDATTRAFSFLEGLITSPDPLEGAGVAADSVRMVDFIDHVAERVDSDLTAEPVARARMLTLLGRVYLNLGRNEQAVRVLDEAVDASRAAFGPSPELVEALGRAGFAQDQHGDRASGETLIREALQMTLALDGEGSLQTAEWQEYLGRSLLDSRRLDEAEPYLRASYETRRALAGDDDPEAARSLTLISALHSYRGEDDRALGAMEEVLGIYARAGLEGNPDYAIIQANLAQLYERAGRFEDADRVAMDAVARLDATMGPGHFLTASTRARLAGIRDRLGRASEADSLYREAIPVLEANAPDNVNLVTFLGSYAGFLHRQGRLDAAEEVARRAVATASRILGEGHPMHGGALLRLGNVLRDRRRDAEALDLHVRARRTMVEALGPDHPESQQASVSLARSWMAVGRTEEAEALLLETWESAREARGPGDRVATAAAETLVELYEAAGRLGDAERYREATAGGAGAGEPTP